MSKRGRLEEERAILQQIEIQKEEDKQKAIVDRIYAPLIWKKLENGIKIQDLQPKQFPEVLNLIEKHYMAQEILCRNVQILDDEVSKKSFLARIEYNLKDRKSIIALDENNDDEIAGFMIMKEVVKSELGRVFSRCQMFEGEAFGKIIKFLNSLNRHVEIYDEFNCIVYLKYYLLCVVPKYRGLALGFQMFQIGWDVARSLDIPVVMGVFSSFNLQKFASKFQMKTLKEISYTKWLDKEGNLIFCNPGPGNYTCAIMAGIVPPPVELEPSSSQLSEETEEEKKMTRIEKRKMNIKKLEKEEIKRRKEAEKAEKAIIRAIERAKALKRI